MVKHHKFFRKLATGFVLITFVFSCSSTITANQTQSSSEEKQKIIYNDLIIDPQTDYIMIPVNLASESKKFSLPNPSAISTDDYRKSGIVGYNVVFYNKKTGESNLLLNKKALISSYDFLLEKIEKDPNPASRKDRKLNLSKKDPIKNRLLLFQIIDNDTNGDGKLDREDAIIGYVYNVAEKSLKQITPANTQLIKWVFDEKSEKVFITIRKESDGNKKFTEEDDLAFLQVSALSPNIGKEMIGNEIHERLKTILLK